MTTVYSLKCPHCGKKPQLFKVEPEGAGGPFPVEWTFECCASMTDTDLKKLLERWDKRADPVLTVMPCSHNITL